MYLSLRPLKQKEKLLIEAKKVHKKIENKFGGKVKDDYLCSPKKSGKKSKGKKKFIEKM